MKVSIALNCAMKIEAKVNEIKGVTHAGLNFATKAIRNISKGDVFDENFLMSVATIGAFIIGEFPEGVAVMLFFQVGMFLQNIAVNRSRKSIVALMDIRPDYANLKIGDDTKKVSPSDVRIGDINSHRIFSLYLAREE